MNEIITTLATEPSVEEWRCIREFKRRTRELAENSLLRNGYDLSANMSWKAGEPSSYTVKATARATGLQAGNQLLRDCHAHIICASFMEDSMSSIHFDTSAPKKATNLSINSDLLRQAKNCTSTFRKRSKITWQTWCARRSKNNGWPRTPGSSRRITGASKKKAYSATACGDSDGAV